MSDKIIYATDASFEQDVLKSDLPVLVDFWAPWCGPCRMLAPILDQLAEELDGKFKVVKINVDDSQAVATQFGIRSIPTLMVFNQGQAVGTKVGALSKNQLEAFMNTSIA